ncbi:MAG: hypothetical protein Q8M24_15605 [Pseudolabrys sp.]|nr:hypothetical protein [Pseudolabrys sp.]MDP2296869.1 hypothetical protein [Pseudolabrys sp.]
MTRRPVRDDSNVVPPNDDDANRWTIGARAEVSPLIGAVETPIRYAKFVAQEPSAPFRGLGIGVASVGGRDRKDANHQDRRDEA